MFDFSPLFLIWQDDDAGNIIFGKASVVLIFLVVDEVLPEEGTLMEKLVQLPEKISHQRTRIN